MRGLELKRIVEILWKNPNAEEEKFPIVPKKCKPATDNGSIPMSRSYSSDDMYGKANGKKGVDDSIESRKEDAPEKMSLLRKLCFFLSLNGGVLYVLVIAWLLPCRWSPCLVTDDVWSSNFSSIRMTTNLETNTLNDPSLLIFGYVDEEGGKLSALRMKDGKQVWNRSMSQIPKHVFCNLRKSAFSNKPTCLVTGESIMTAIESENGNLIWEQNHTSTKRIRKIALTAETGRKAFLIGISGHNMRLYDAVDGTEIATISLPCSWTIDVKVAGPWPTKHGSMWALICEYDDGMEVWTFQEKELLNISENSTDPDSLKNIKFKSLFSKQSYSGSIDLVGDVTTTPNSLVLSWADMVTMVTAQAPFHHFHKTWERRFSSLLGYAVDVTSLTIGHFIDSKSMHIAAAIQDDVNTSIFILDTGNGSTVHEWELGAKKVTAVKKILGAEGESDALLLESSENADLSNGNSDILERSFYSLQYEENKTVLRLIATAKNFHASSFSSVSKGKSNLLVAKTNLLGDLVLDRYIIQNKDPGRSWCKDKKNDLSNSSIVMFLD